MKFNKLRDIFIVGAAMMIALPSLGHAAYEEVDVKGGGSIKGKVTFSGDLPVDAVEKIVIAKNPDVCGEGYREVVWVDVKDGALRGSFVFIDKISKGKKWPTEWEVGGGQPKSPKPVIDQHKCRFTLWAQVIKRGEILIRHRDPASVLHNINTRELIGVEKGRVVKRTLFNFGQPDPGDIPQELKPRRSSYISINCEAHNFMFGFRMAPKHPYAVVVGEDGSYSIDNVPPGDYLVKSWHPRFGVQKTKVTVAGGAATNADFAFKDAEK